MSSPATLETRESLALAGDRPAARHALTVRVTHWLTVVAFLALLVTGLEIVVSHPRFYWGETGTDQTKAAFIIPIPASRDLVPTGYHTVLPDENGWSRYLHFEAAWLLLFTALVYGAHGLVSGHFRRDLLPARGERSWGAVRAVIGKYLRRAPPDAAHRYNVLQRLAYLAVIFVVFPMMFWTGLAMSPSFTAAFPSSVALLGGRQTARTLHFLLTWALVGFVVIHVVMVWMAGFWSRVRAMVTGRAAPAKEAR